MFSFSWVVIECYWKDVLCCYESVLLFLRFSCDSDELCMWGFVKFFVGGLVIEVFDVFDVWWSGRCGGRYVWFVVSGCCL